MALCCDCGTVIPCHCHLSPPVEIRPGVYLAAEPHPAKTTDHTTEK
jgi:hypothetical protein